MLYYTTEALRRLGAVVIEGVKFQKYKPSLVYVCKIIRLRADDNKNQEDMVQKAEKNLGVYSRTRQDIRKEESQIGNCP